MTDEERYYCLAASHAHDDATDATNGVDNPRCVCARARALAASLPRELMLLCESRRASLSGFCRCAVQVDATAAWKV